VKAPKRVGVRIAGRTYRARILAPASIAPGGTASVRVKLPVAWAALEGRRARLRVPLVVSSGEGVARIVVDVALRRDAG